MISCFGSGTPYAGLRNLGRSSPLGVSWLASRTDSTTGRCRASVVDLIDELSGALADSGPVEAGLSKMSWKVAREAADRAASSIRNDPPEVANLAAK
jgi:hypothetical protein